ncbi:MAG: DUF2130 domain-containing protein [Cyclobacteriaceae bacterium]
MDTSLSITCPNCDHEFQAEQAFKKHLTLELAQKSKELEKEFQGKQQTIERELERLAVKEQNLDNLVTAALREKEKSLKEDLSIELEKEYASSIDSYRKKVEAQSAQIKDLRQKEIEIEDLKGKLADQGQEMEIKYKRQLNEKLEEERAKVQESTQEEFSIKLREKQEMLDQQRTQIELMRKKIEQGSMQLQGEVQELIIEEKLRALFPDDEVTEVGKGIRGADVLQHVMNNGALCGTILYESKNTQTFGKDWIDKLRADQMNCGASTAILVTKAMSKDFDGEYYTDKGVIVCSVRLFPVVAALCRHKLVELKHQASRLEMQKDSSGLLYQYLTSDEFRMHLEEVVLSVMEIKEQVVKEKAAFEKQWKQRDKQADRIVSNLAQVFGSIKGIGGASIKEIKSLDLLN